MRAGNVSQRCYGGSMIATAMYDVCVVGHVTRDVVRLPSGSVTMPGGTAFYAGIAYARLGLSTAIVTKTAHEDASLLLSGLVELGCSIASKASAASTNFENIVSNDLASRAQRVLSVAEGFVERDLHGIRARLIHLGPLTSREMSADFVSAAKEHGDRVLLDAQGIVRVLDGNEVRFTDCSDKEQILSKVDILKADAEEARILTGERDVERGGQQLSRLGPKEVLVTLGAEGALLFVDGTATHVAPFHVTKAVDPTGAGDTFSAAYGACRLRDVPPKSAARFASAVASLSVECSGPLAATRADVEQRLARGESCSRL